MRDRPTFFLIMCSGIGFVVVYFYLYASFLHWKSLRVKLRLRRFKAYENSIREKWGDDAIEEFLLPQKIE